MFTHCTTRDLLALRQSCRAAGELLERSEKVRPHAASHSSRSLDSPVVVGDGMVLFVEAGMP